MHLSHIPQCTIQNRNVLNWCIVGFGTGALWDLWIWSIIPPCILAGKLPVWVRAVYGICNGIISHHLILNYFNISSHDVIYSDRICKIIFIYIANWFPCSMATSSVAFHIFFPNWTFDIQHQIFGASRKTTGVDKKKKIRWTVSDFISLALLP